MTSRLRFRDMPVGRKLMALGLGLTAALLVVVTGFTAGKEVFDWRRQAADQLDSQARIIAANSASALLFADPRAAADTLAALKAAPEVVFGGVYGANGKLFASYGELAQAPSEVAPRDLQAVGHRFTASHLIVTEPILLQGQRLGVVYLTSDMRGVYSDMVRDIAILLVVSAVAFGVSMLLFSRLQRRIVAPLIDLTRVMEQVSESRDYTVRLTPSSEDEVGVLTRSFNDMLEVVKDRESQLAGHQALLEETVRQRTAELNVTNTKLEGELVERKAAQASLSAHDAMLKAVAHSAAMLLGGLNLDDAISAVMELIGRTLVVGRVQLCPIVTDHDGHLRSKVQQEWFPSGGARLENDPLLNDLDLTMILPSLAAASLVGDSTTLRLEDLPEGLREPFARGGARSILFVPVMAEGKLWGGLWFIDSAPVTRAWNWAETDALSLLAGLVGVATTRARYVKELADANTIVQNSPTILYRLKGDPKLPLTYISHNVTKFGYDPAALIEAADFVHSMVYPDDQAALLEVMAHLTDKDSSGAILQFRMIVPSGGFRWVENRYTPVRDEAGRLIEVEGMITDITERKRAEEKIALLARTDSLTGLANRATFVERLQQAFTNAKRSGRAFAVLYLDLDHFKDINDTRGHPVGDLLLRETADRLKARVRDSDLVARFGGDEFAILQSDIGDPADAGALGGDIVAELAKPYLIQGNELRVTTSVGISPFSPSTVGPDAMLAQADLALYRAKDDGRNQYRFHTEDLDRQVNQRVAMANDLRGAIARNELFLTYQPQVELQSGRIVGMEALIRWRHPSRGVLAPAEFLPIAEGTGAISEIGGWVLDNACAQMQRWRQAGIAPPVIAVNASMQQLQAGKEFVESVLATLKRHHLKPTDMELDVTESMLAKVTLAQNDVLDRLTAAGIRLALDHFGMEYSTFDYLRAYHVDRLKVARQFIEGAGSDAGQAATVRAIIGLGRELGVKVVAEGVETKEQRAMLLAMGPSARAQGFYFSEPIDAERAFEMLRRGDTLPAETPAEAPRARRKRRPAAPAA